MTVVRADVRAGRPVAAVPTPRAPRYEELRSDDARWSTLWAGRGQGVVNPGYQWGSGLVKAVNPYFHPLRVRERKEIDRATALTALTTVTTGGVS